VASAALAAARDSPAPAPITKLLFQFIGPPVV
jgi:hypothetical protein